MPVEIFVEHFFSTDSHNFYLKKNKIVLIHSGSEQNEDIMSSTSM